MSAVCTDAFTGAVNGASKSLMHLCCLMLVTCNTSQLGQQQAHVCIRLQHGLPGWRLSLFPSFARSAVPACFMFDLHLLQVNMQAGRPCACLLLRHAWLTSLHTAADAPFWTQCNQRPIKGHQQCQICARRGGSTIIRRHGMAWHTTHIPAVLISTPHAKHNDLCQQEWDSGACAPVSHMYTVVHQLH